MIRVVGCFMLIVSGAVTGKILSDKVEERFRTVRSLYEMSCEIIPMLDALMTTREIFDELSYSDKYRSLEFLRCDISSPVGRSELDGLIDVLNVSDDLKMRLKAYFGGFGSSDIERERAKAALMNSFLRNEFEEQRSGYKSAKKLRMVLGLLGGAFAAVIMI